MKRFIVGCLSLVGLATILAIAYTFIAVPINSQPGRDAHPDEGFRHASKPMTSGKADDTDDDTVRTGGRKEKSVYVKPYTRSDGVQVQGHMRSK